MAGAFAVRPTVRRRRRVVLAVAVAAALLIAGCGDDGRQGDETARGNVGDGTPAAGAFPVTIKHALGETTITKEPQRVVTLGWGSADAAIAMGVVPVAIPYQDYGGDERGVVPWIRQRLEADKAAMPTVLPNVKETPFEAVAAARPDVILAVYSGITADEYGKLSAIAPTVAYPQTPWATPWRDTVKIVGQALGRSEQADAVLAKVDSTVQETTNAHPEIKGKTVATVADFGGTAYVYRSVDPRVQFLLDLGLVSAPSVDQLASGDQTFYYSLSYEQLSRLTSDILVTYAPTAEASRKFLDGPQAKAMNQVKRGAVAEVVGEELVASVSPPTALSVTWGLDEYAKLLSKAASVKG